MAIFLKANSEFGHEYNVVLNALYDLGHGLYFWPSSNPTRTPPPKNSLR